ncbi:hypothetical protein [Streptomyces sp. MZ04]|uniref:hypothetical protein n=1 Tax=Streptomyces sp. MZ04 TaxID=2559236 RepID=UPI00107E823C|nr:hypothetical protein [Streptomyces sp. MZ04]TGA95369.1 hypothetical protein E2651_34350 [Streptomyces sp. MZ04]
MLNQTGKALLVGATAALAVTTAAPANAQTGARTEAAASVSKHQEVRCVKQSGRTCVYSVSFFYWNKKGSTKRGLNYVQTARSPYKAGKARWLYKQPGGSTHVGKSWRPAHSVPHGNAAEVEWGKPGATTGPKFRKGTLVCVQWKNLSQKACHKLK